MATTPSTARARDGDSREQQAGAPTEPVDYGAINAVYVGLLATLVVANRERIEDDPVTGRELLPIGIATFALAKSIAKEKIGTWVREPFVEETGHDERRPRGRRLRHAVGELLSCTRCVGAWSALMIVGLRFTSPPAGRAVTTVLAAAGLNDFLQAGFRWLTGEADEAAS